tara:strand:- start:330 stop:479 length:150 start_codon:yes stop_codon:yes gene_type:complete
MRVYLVMNGRYEPKVEGVFKTKELAKKFALKELDGEWFIDNYIVIDKLN